jgi:hypothetical protein
MNIKQLKAAIADLPDDMVVVRDFEDGWEPVTKSYFCLKNCLTFKTQ